MMNRPTQKELLNKIRSARQAIASKEIFIVNVLAVAADAIELGYDVESELEGVLGELLEEITPGLYVGKRPPMRSYEQVIEGIELFPFQVESSRFKCHVYLKFALQEGRFWLVSLHQSRAEGGTP